MSLGALVGGALGLLVGASAPPRHIGSFFVAGVMPLMFTGAAQFPFLGLDHLRWFQVIVALNPLTYNQRGDAVVAGSGSALDPTVDRPAGARRGRRALLVAGTACFRRRAQD